MLVLQLIASLTTLTVAGDSPDTRDCRFDLSKLSATVVDAAAAFRKKSHDDRTGEFKTLLNSGVFPVSPTEQVDQNTIRWDPNRVNCIMTSSDLRGLLGRPTERRTGEFVYRLIIPKKRKDEHGVVQDVRCNAVFSVDSGRVNKLIGFEGDTCASLFKDQK